MVKQWIYDPNTDNCIIEKESGVVIMHTEDINPEVISRVVEMWNDEYSQKKIESYIDSQIDDNRLTPDEAEFLKEEITAMFIVAENEQPTAPTVVNEDDDLPFKQDVIEEKKEIVTEPIKQPIMESTTEQKPAETPVVTRQKRGPNVATTAGKKKAMSIGEFKQQMQEKILIIETLDAVKLPEFPQDLSNDSKKLLLGFHKEYNALIEKYVIMTQEL
jgi:hypothetical protein